MVPRTDEMTYVVLLSVALYSRPVLLSLQYLSDGNGSVGFGEDAMRSFCFLYFDSDGLEFVSPISDGRVRVLHTSSLLKGGKPALHQLAEKSG